ncbi:MAG: glycogen synthase [Candidatus Izemoplasmatales bacterium]|nr:glycogen synthase [Candidatus Izemoplasmatales bacterium]
MNILFVAAECSPFVKIGGLADVIGSLPQALKHLNNCEVRVIIPKYKIIPNKYKDKMSLIKEFWIELGDKKTIYVGLQTLKLGAIRYYFIDNLYSFGDRDNVYNYNDDSERFAYFQKAVIESLPYLDFKPDIIHVNDWHAAMIPLLLKSKYSQYDNIKTVLTIHNLAYQGIFSINDYHYFNINYDSRFEYEGFLNYLKSGIVCADLVTTVSETYAKEIMTDAFGHGMQLLLRQRASSVVGIINGISHIEYNPASDRLLAENYDYLSVESGKKSNKLMLYRRLNADFNIHLPLISIISRLVEQKGLDLVCSIIEEVLDTYECVFVVLGNGEADFETFFQKLAIKYPKKVRIYIGFDNRLAHLIYAASDLFLMPSKFEPCGLGQLIALRYGTLPLVRETGGLADTVIPYNELDSTGYGFSFSRYNPKDLHKTINYALNIYNDSHKSWDLLVQNAMAADFGWPRFAKLYKKQYHKLLKG